MTTPPPSIRVVLPLAATALFTLLTGCTCPEGARNPRAITSATDTAGVNLNAPGPHQILVYVTRKDGSNASAPGGPAKPRRDKVLVTIEPEFPGAGNYVVKHNRFEDKPDDK